LKALHNVFRVGIFFERGRGGLRPREKKKVFIFSKGPLSGRGSQLCHGGKKVAVGAKIMNQKSLCLPPVEKRGAATSYEKKRRGTREMFFKREKEWLAPKLEKKGFARTSNNGRRRKGPTTAWQLK